MKGGLGLRLGRHRQAVFNPLSALFSLGELGAWSSPGDLSSRYQESTGVTAAVVGQPEGLALDKRLGLVRGSELVSNGTFDTDVAGWTAGVGTIAWAAGSLEVTRSAGTSSGYQAETTVVGQWYEVTASQRVVSGGISANIVVREGDNPGASPVLSNGTASASTSWNLNRCIFKATGTTSYIHLTASVTTGVCGFASVSVRSLAGNHLIQATAAARPKLVSVNGYIGDEFLGVDDSMTSATGGGGTTGFFFCAAVKVTGGAGTDRTIWTDVGANTGYQVSIDSGNLLKIFCRQRRRLHHSRQRRPVGSRQHIRAYRMGCRRLP